MTQHRLIRVALFVFVLSAPCYLAWGVFGHEHINKAAVMALPAPVQTFFYNHIDYITQESTVPDLRKYTLQDKAEHPRHFIDLENFGGADSLPLTLADAKLRYDDKYLQQNGILPWYLAEMMDKLTKAFREKHKTEILFLAADLGHYIGDAHMPLHTSANHDGQKTNQKGVHAFWEAQLPELFGKKFNYHVSQAHFIADIPAEIRKMIFESHKLVDTLLLAEKKTHQKFAENKIYVTDDQGAVKKNKYGQPVHSEGYAAAFNLALNGMVERQLTKAIEATASFWYTAWVNAGKPDVLDLDPAELSAHNSARLKADQVLWLQGKLFGIESEKEF